jgi:hypothetical protein
MTLTLIIGFFSSLARTEQRECGIKGFSGIFLHQIVREIKLSSPFFRMRT